MKKKIAALLVAILVLFPKTSRADLDVLSIIQDALKVFQEKANTVIQGYIGIQVNLQDIAMNRNIVGALRDSVKDQLREKANTIVGDLKNAAMEGAQEFVNHQLSSVMLPGLNNSISLGPYTSPVLKQKVAKSYVKRKNQKSDVIVNLKQDDRNNAEMVKNLAIIYSNALTRRKQLIDREKIGCDTNVIEDSEDGAENPDVSTLQYNYGLTSRRANCRWLEILKFEATYRKAMGELYLTSARVDDISEIAGTEESEIDTEGLEDIEAEVIGERKSVDVLALKDQWNSGKEALKNGDYAGALNAAASAYGIGAVEGNQNVVDIVRSGAAGAGDAYNSARDGNWSGVVSGVGGTVGSSVGGNIGSEIGATGNLIGGGMNVISSGGNANEVFDNLMTNGNIQSGLSDLGNLDTSQEEAIERAKQEEAERLRQQLQEDMAKAQQEMKQKMCQECRDAAVKAGRDPGMSCLGACS